MVKNMIKEIYEKDIVECVKGKKESFLTFADEVGYTVDNALRFTAYAIAEDRLPYQFKNEYRPMFAYYNDSKNIGHYSL